MVKQDIRWLAPTPLWQNGGDIFASVNNPFRRPTILRFDNDDFMSELMGLLDSTPERLKAWVAKTETWRKPMSKTIEVDAQDNAELLPLLRRARGLPVVKQASIDKHIISQDTDGALKLFQPAQQRFYLISAALVCKTAGLPDRRINTSAQEKVTFILRRVIDNCEYAFVASGQGFEWQKVAPNEEANIKKGEERLPLFNLNYQQQPAKNRRMLAGLIPVSRREAYLGSALASSDLDTDEEEIAYSPLRMLFETQIAAPWKALLEQVELQKFVIQDTLASTEGTDKQLEKAAAEILKTTRENIQTASWYILLDLAKFLQTYFPNIWDKVNDDSRLLNDDDETALYNLINAFQPSPPLNNTFKNEIKVDANGNVEYYSNGNIKYHNITGTIVSTMLQALRLASENESKLETVDRPYIRPPVHDSNETDNNWPDFLFPLTDPDIPFTDQAGNPLDEKYIDNIVEAADKLLHKVKNKDPEIPALKIQSKKNDNNARFVIRCVYEQPSCEPLHPPVVSEASEAFQMASFFDFDAPARPVRIPMPMDISPAGLRKYQKNTSLVISDMLCGKMEKIKKFSFGDLVLSVLPWPFHKDLPNVNDTAPCGKSDNNNFGMFCSLSIPIVTLCALILLIIMVKLFDIFFKWIPYLFMCLPIPGLKGKN